MNIFFLPKWWILINSSSGDMNQVSKPLHLTCSVEVRKLFKTISMVKTQFVSGVVQSVQHRTHSVLRPLSHIRKNTSLWMFLTVTHSPQSPGHCRCRPGPSRVSVGVSWCWTCFSSSCRSLSSWAGPLSPTLLKCLFHCAGKRRCCRWLGAHYWKRQVSPGKD